MTRLTSNAIREQEEMETEMVDRVAKILSKIGSVVVITITGFCTTIMECLSVRLKTESLKFQTQSQEKLPNDMSKNFIHTPPFFVPYFHQFLSSFECTLINKHSKYQFF